MKTVIVTGALGFLGAQVCQDLTADGLRVVRIDRQGLRGDETSAIDLLDVSTAYDKMHELPRPDVVVHLAAIAHNQQPPVGHTTLSANTLMLRMVLDALSEGNPQFIFASSIAVYGEANRLQIVRPDDELRPASEYGRSKMACEHMLQKSSLTDVDIFRFCPVFDTSHLQDVAKRVQLPGCAALRMRILPEPAYNLCHLATAVRQILLAVQKGRQGRKVANIFDPSPYRQQELRQWFQGPSVPIPVLLVSPLLGFLKRVPGSTAYAINCNLEKLFHTHLFDDKPVVLDIGANRIWGDGHEAKL